MAMFRSGNFCLLNICVGGHKALAEVTAEFMPSERLARREEYLRVPVLWAF
jgi:hypothetical protein